MGEVPEALLKSIEESKPVEEPVDKAGQEANAEEATKEGEETNAGEAKKQEARPMEVEEEADEPDIDMVGIDTFGIDDVCNVGPEDQKTVGLFRDFGIEDFIMMTLRFELHLLVHAFRKDVNDPDRPGFHLSNLDFYYSRYYKKPLSYPAFGVASAKELIALV